MFRYKRSIQSSSARLRDSRFLVLNDYNSYFMNVLIRKGNSLIKRVLSTFSFTILVLNILSGQNFEYFNETENLHPLVVMLSQDVLVENMGDSIQNLCGSSKSSFLLVNASQVSINGIVDSINIVINQEESIDKTRIYLIVVGNKVFFDKYKQLSNRLFPSKYYIQTGPPIVDSTEFKVVRYNKMNLKEIVSAQSKTKLWQFDLDQLKKISIAELEPNNRAWEVGVGYSRHYPGPIKTDDEFPRVISAVEFQIAKNLNEKYKIWSSLAFNQIMFLNKKKGDMDPMDIDINKEISESMMFTRSLSLTRFFYVTQSNGFKPYMSLGFSHTHLSLIYAEIKGSNPDMEMKQYSCGSLMFSPGLEINLSDQLRLNVRTSYHISLNSYNTMNNFNMTFALSYLIQRKGEPYYEYFRLK